MRGSPFFGRTAFNKSSTNLVKYHMKTIKESDKNKEKAFSSRAIGFMSYIIHIVTMFHQEIQFHFPFKQRQRAPPNPSFQEQT